MDLGQGYERLGPEEGGVARDDEEVAAVIGVVLVERGHGGRHGIAGPPLHPLLHEVEVQAVRGLFGHRLGDPLATVADDHNGPVEG
jgi:hypothetical protein